MSEAHTGGCAGDAIHEESRNMAAFGVADWLSLAAAPTFAAMALLTAVFDHDLPGLLCFAPQGWSLSGMVPMYVLMSIFHAAPWLKLMPSRRNGVHRS